MKYLLSGGGTGGHIYPALSIIREIEKNDKQAQILYIGKKDSIEERLVKDQGIDFKTIRVQGLPRKINKDFFISLRELFYGLRQAKKIIKDFKPDIAIGTGGYVSGPVILQAKRNKVPCLIHEQNVFPGITNKILGRFVDRIAITYGESIKYFKNPNKIVETGNPIREEIFQIDKETAYKMLNIRKDLPLILSFGGSGGQKKLNDSILYMIEEKLISDKYQLIHVTGERFYENFMEKLEGENLGPWIQILSYLYDMPQALNIADLLISSSGAITLAEISALGLASILIPKAYTAENHQEYNARIFEKNKASILILEKDLNGESLMEAIRKILENDSLLSQMKENSKKLGRLNAEKKIYEEISDLLKKK